MPRDAVVEASGNEGLRDAVRSDSRRAGDVIRYASWPHLRTQTTGAHTWQVMRILTTIWPRATADALVFALHHDSGELGSGDIPYPHKLLRPELKAIMDELEAESLLDQDIQVPDPGPDWRWRIKTCDLIEMLEQGMDEVIMGNRYGVPIVHGMESMLHQRVMVDTPPTQADRSAVEVYMRNRWVRFRELEKTR